MSADLDRLRVFAGEADVVPVRGGTGSEKTWRPPVLEEFARGFVLAFDQSITATGWVLLQNLRDPMMIGAAGSFGAKDPKRGGWETYLNAARETSAMFGEVLGRFETSAIRITVAHEAPPAGGGKFSDPASSLLTAYILRDLAIHRGYVLAPMVAAQTHKRLICGKGNAAKVEEHRSLANLAVTLPIDGYETVTNEPKRDALCVALAHLLREGAHGGSR